MSTQDQTLDRIRELFVEGAYFRMTADEMQHLSRTLHPDLAPGHIIHSAEGDGPGVHLWRVRRMFGPGRLAFYLSNGSNTDGHAVHEVFEELVPASNFHFQVPDAPTKQLVHAFLQTLGIDYVCKDRSGTSGTHRWLYVRTDEKRLTHSVGFCHIGWSEVTRLPQPRAWVHTELVDGRMVMSLTDEATNLIRAAASPTRKWKLVEGEVVEAKRAVYLTPREARLFSVLLGETSPCLLEQAGITRHSWELRDELGAPPVPLEAWLDGTTSPGEDTVKYIKG